MPGKTTVLRGFVFRSRNMHKNPAAGKGIRGIRSLSLVGGGAFRKAGILLMEPPSALPRPWQTRGTEPDYAQMIVENI